MSPKWKRISDRGGLTLIETLIFLSISFVVVAAVIEMLNQVLVSKAATDRLVTISNYSNNVGLVVRNQGEWLKQLRVHASTSALLESCLPKQTCQSGTGPPSAMPCNPVAVTFSCPAADADALADLAASPYSTRVAGRTVTSVALVGMSGGDIAGARGSPLFLSTAGVPQPAGSCGGGGTMKCFFRATGYFVRANASGDPGDIDFAIRLDVPNYAGGSPIGTRTEYYYLELGTLWKHF